MGSEMCIRDSPSAIGVAVNVGCWSHRRGHIIFDKDLNYTIDTHSGVTL